MYTAAEARLVSASHRKFSKGYTLLREAINKSILEGRNSLKESHRNKDELTIDDHEWKELESLGYELKQFGNYLSVNW